MNVFRQARTLIAAAGAAAALLAASAGAGAKTLVTMDGVATPPITKFTLRPQTLFTTLDTRFASDVPGALPGTVARATIFIPNGPRFNSRFFPSCSPRKLRRLRGNPRACPRGSRIGGGTVIGTSPQFAGVNEHAKVELYNGPHGRSMVFFIHGENPVAVSGIIVAPLKPLHSRKWGYRLTLPIPHGLQEIASGIFVSVLDFKVKLGGRVVVHRHGRAHRYGYLEALACPLGALVPIRGVFAFRGGEKATTDSYIACGHR